MTTIKFHVGQKVWLNQGAIPLAEIMETTEHNAKLKIRGWLGLQWFPMSKLVIEHPVTWQNANKTCWECLGLNTEHKRDCPTLFRKCCGAKITSPHHSHCLQKDMP